jgi:hypothetical protein
LFFSESWTLFSISIGGGWIIWQDWIEPSCLPPNLASASVVGGGPCLCGRCIADSLCLPPNLASASPVWGWWGVGMVRGGDEGPNLASASPVFTEVLGSGCFNAIPLGATADRHGPVDLRLFNKAGGAGSGTTTETVTVAARPRWQSLLSTDPNVQTDTTVRGGTLSLPGTDTPSTGLYMTVAGVQSLVSVRGVHLTMLNFSSAAQSGTQGPQVHLMCCTSSGAGLGS